MGNASRFLADSEHLLQVAMKSLFDQFAQLYEGAVVVDQQARIVWMNEHYPKWLGIKDPGAAIGRPIEEVIPNSLMRVVVETGRPIMLDIMDSGTESFVVTRLPLRDADGSVIGGIGLMLYDNAEQLAPILTRYLRMRADLADAKKRLADARRVKYTLSSFVGVHPACVEMKRLARHAARSDSAVLLLGETGTGKELLAQAIHAASLRADGPFVAVNVAAIPETLLEAEFFGVAPGAFTGADRRGRDGKFSLADGGTLFLDEIGDMSPALQAKLLRSLQEKEIEPVGSNRLLAVDVRVIAATSRDLAAMVADGRFRADLFYRLNVLTLDIPPLRERLQDLGPLCEHLLEHLCRRLGLPPREVSPTAVERLCEHGWPGNVRELNNVLERALLLGEQESLGPGDFDRVLPRRRSATVIPIDSKSPPRPAATSLEDALASAEREALRLALRACGGRKALAAKRLGISRSSLYEKIALHGLEAESASE